MFCELQLFSTHLLSHNKNKGEKCRAISLMNNTFFWYWPNLRQKSFQNAVLKFLLNSGTFSEQLLSSFWGYLVHTSCPLLYVKEQNVPSIIWTPKHFVFLRQLKVSEWYKNVKRCQRLVELFHWCFTHCFTKKGFTELDGFHLWWQKTGSFLIFTSAKEEKS